MASVGVCTRPTVVLKKPPDLELNAVMARVPLMPTSQSASERLMAASEPEASFPGHRASARSRPNGGRGHGLQPQPLDRLFGLRVANDVTENQLAFPPGVARIDQAQSTSLRLMSLASEPQAADRSIQWAARSKCGGNHRQIRRNSTFLFLGSTPSGTASSSR